MPEIVRRIKRPIPVDTLEWDGENADAMREFCGPFPNGPIPRFAEPDPAGGVHASARVWNSEERCWINVPVGHHLAKGPLGELYPISPAALAETYDDPDQARDAALAASEAHGETTRTAAVLREILARYRPLTDHKGRVAGWTALGVTPADFDRWAAVAFTATGAAEEELWALAGTHLAALDDQPEPGLRDQIATALNSAPSTYRRSHGDTAPWQHHNNHRYYGGCALCYGETEPLTDAVLAVVQPLLDAKQDEADALRGFVEQGFDTHMQFGVIEVSGTTTMLPCADWCYACKLENAERLRIQMRELAAKLDDESPWDANAPEIGAEILAILDRNQTPRPDVVHPATEPQASTPPVVDESAGLTHLQCRRYDGNQHPAHAWRGFADEPPVWCEGIPTAQPIHQEDDQP